MSNVFTYWNINWAATIGMLALIVLYLAYHNYKFGWWTKPFFAALLLLVICFFSPLYVLSHEYLFSAHMVVHVLLLLVVGPLLLASLYRRNSDNKFISNLSQLLSRKPAIGWFSGVGIMWFWHLPFVFNYCMNVEHTAPAMGAVMHILESITLLLAGVLFGWPLISPVKELKLPALQSVVYLFTACIGCSILGLLITFAPGGIFKHFLSAADSYNLNDIILNNWQINQSMDQQIAGLIMWVPCCFLYVVYALYLLIVWFNEKDVVKAAKA